jgi:hypothetical protein
VVDSRKELPELRVLVPAYRSLASSLKARDRILHFHLVLCPKTISRHALASGFPAEPWASAQRLMGFGTKPSTGMLLKRPSKNAPVQPSNRY